MDGNSRMRQKRMICVVGKVEKTHRQEDNTKEIPRGNYPWKFRGLTRMENFFENKGISESFL